MRSDMLIASSWSCVTYSTVMPRRCWISLISTCISKRRFLSRRAERLVHQHDRRVEDDRAGQCDTLLLPTGQLMRVAIGEAAEPHQLERPIHPLGDVVFRPAPRAQRESHILEDIEWGKIA